MAPIGPAWKHLVDEAHRLFGSGVYARDNLPDLKNHHKMLKGLKVSIMPPKLDGVLCMKMDALMSKMTLEQRKLLIPLRFSSKELTQGGAQFQYPVDAVVTALGWTYDRSVFDKSVQFDMVQNPKRKEKSTKG